MASREFTDRAGQVWRVWEVGQSHMHPVTKLEEYLDSLADGWLVFESEGMKRRLPAPYPRDWAERSLADLEALCRQAQPVVARRDRTATGEFRLRTEQSAGETARAETERAFASPRGRQWRVRVHECTTSAGSGIQVLRFTSGDSVVDLMDWPADWKSLTRDDYALLLLDAVPPRRIGRGMRPQRRMEDRPEEDPILASRPIPGGG